MKVKSKAQEKLKIATRKTAKRLKPRTAKFITRAEARQRAEQHVFNRMFKGATVRDGAEAKVIYYNRNEGQASDVWVVYKGPPVIGFRSSEVVVVCKRTGRVLYEGSANDEG